MARTQNTRATSTQIRPNILGIKGMRAAGKATGNGSIFHSTRLLGRDGLVLALLCTSGAVPAWAQDLTTPQSQTETVAPTADITTIPESGVSGQAGRAGYYTCSGGSMTWGAACAAIYSFGNFDTHAAGNGGDAPVSGTVASVSSTVSCRLWTTIQEPWSRQGSR